MNYKSILCLNGELPDKDFLKKFNLPIISADGAANKLQEIGIIPSAVIGDLDSIKAKEDLNLVYVEDQDQCDYEKSLNYLETHGLLPTIVIGINGGDLDHVLNNISVFMSNHYSNLLCAPPLYGVILRKSNNSLELPINTKISIIGLPEAIITTKGLQWELTEQKLFFPGFNSCLNRMKNNKLSIQILEGQILFLAHNFFCII